MCRYGYVVSHFDDAESECHRTLDRKLALPAYDYCLKASHLFNLLDARGVIGVTERASYIARVRALAKRCCEVYLECLPTTTIHTENKEIA